MKTVKCKVVMLSTENISRLLVSRQKDNTLSYLSLDKVQKIQSYFKDPINYQHLYITSDEEIKDVIYTRFKTNISKYKGEYFYHNGEEIIGKIISTTDPELNIKEPCLKCDGTGEMVKSGTYQTNFQCNLCNGKKSIKINYLPKPTEGFIKKFIEKYNKGEIITDILVEYNNCCCASFDSDHTDKRCNNLKLSSQNEIIIHPSKQNWTREEVIKLIKNSYNSCAMHHSIVNQELEEWIEENL